jgi:hypothetical protein
MTVFRCTTFLAAGPASESSRSVGRAREGWRFVPERRIAGVSGLQSHRTLKGTSEEGPSRVNLTGRRIASDGCNSINGRNE